MNDSSARRFKGLCSLEFIAEADNAETYLGVDIAVGRPARRKSDTQILAQLHGTAMEDRIAATVRADFDMEVVVIASDRPVDGSAGWAGEQVPEIGPKSTAQSRLVPLQHSLNAARAYTDATFKPEIVNRPG